MHVEVEQMAQLLSACLHDPNSNTEAQLDAASRQPGFGPRLLTMALTASTSASTNKQQEGIQQLGLVILKKYCKEHWHESSRRFTPPVSVCIRACCPSSMCVDALAGAWCSPDWHRNSISYHVCISLETRNCSTQVY